MKAGDIAYLVFIMLCLGLTILALSLFIQLFSIPNEFCYKKLDMCAETIETHEVFMRCVIDANPTTECLVNWSKQTSEETQN